MNWYKTAKFSIVAQPNQPTQLAPTPEGIQPQQAGQQAQPNQQDEQAASQEIVSNIDKLKNTAIKWMLDNEMVIKYISNPTDASRQELTKASLTYAVRTVMKELPYIGRLANVMPIDKLIQKVPGMKQASDVFTKFIFDNLRVGFIPDELSGQSPLLQQWDLPDDIAQQFQGKISELVKQNPVLAQNFILIILRIKNDKNLLEAQRALMGT